MSSQITIVDYGLGNLLSVSKAFEYFGASIEIANSPERILMAERLVLPGVGSFADGIHQLSQLDLIEALRSYAANNRPLLGICLGMQLMLDTGEEFGRHPGLGLIPGQVLHIPRAGVDGAPHKVPHIGWSGLYPAQGPAWGTPLMEGIELGAATYFVHSYYAQPRDPAHLIAEADYNGVRIPAVIRRNRLYGCQFHPEKSGPVGLRIIQNFLTV